jgi:A/G-specific adenine glycosylase
MRHTVIDLRIFNSTLFNALFMKKKDDVCAKSKISGINRATHRNHLTTREIGKFQQKIYRYYKKYGRNLPWRMTQNPYHILVSEIMLQQTQVQRVLGKYEEFIRIFPDFYTLAHAPFQTIFKVWQGLGYNRRAKALQQIAQKVIEGFQGNLPSSLETLITFPGIGGATASAIAAFAFNQPAAFIETNIRRVFIHGFFPEKTDIKDTEILPLVEETLDTSDPRTWYYALMDYGVMLKQQHENPNRRSAHYQRQSPFQGSNRQIRGMILKLLNRKIVASEQEIAEEINMPSERVKNTLNHLMEEGFIRKKGRKYQLGEPSIWT